MCRKALCFESQQRVSSAHPHPPAIPAPYRSEGLQKWTGSNLNLPVGNRQSGRLGASNFWKSSVFKSPTASEMLKAKNEK